MVTLESYIEHLFFERGIILNETTMEMLIEKELGVNLRKLSGMMLAVSRKFKITVIFGWHLEIKTVRDFVDYCINHQLTTDAYQSIPDSVGVKTR